MVVQHSLPKLFFADEEFGFYHRCGRLLDAIPAFMYGPRINAFHMAQDIPSCSWGPTR
jgi:hypothetical protein